MNDVPRALPVRAKSPYAPRVKPGGGKETFDTPQAERINRARVAHLASLGLPLEGKRVLDVGSGPGHMGIEFARMVGELLCVDVRPENIERMKELYPALHGAVADVEQDDLARFGMFDAVLCYGLLYHLENPLLALRNIARVCGEFLVLESILADCDRPLLLLDDEPAQHNQAVRGLGCRPTASYITMALTRVGFPHVYAPRRVPDHDDFRVEWRNDLAWSRDGHLLRGIFVASRRPRPEPSLVSLVQ
jgi:SAM-dependent methyltransferase